jgi:hypothetical protein
MKLRESGALRRSSFSRASGAPASPVPDAAMVASIDRLVRNNVRRIKRRAGTSKQLKVRADRHITASMVASINNLALVTPRVPVG